MPSHIALRGLPIENLKRKPFRTGALLAVVTILALTFFGGTMLTMNLNTGMTSMEKRLGADLMVVPQNTVQKAEALLTNGNPSTSISPKTSPTRSCRPTASHRPPNRPIYHRWPPPAVPKSCRSSVTTRTLTSSSNHGSPPSSKAPLKTVR